MKPYDYYNGMRIEYAGGGFAESTRNIYLCYYPTSGEFMFGDLQYQNYMPSYAVAVFKLKLKPQINETNLDKPI